MIEREAQIRVYNETLGAKGARARLVRVAAEGFYEVTLDQQGRSYTTLLPISSTVIVAQPPAEASVIGTSNITTNHIRLVTMDTSVGSGHWAPGLSGSEGRFFDAGRPRRVWRDLTD